MVDLIFLFLLSQQTVYSVPISTKAYLSRFIDEILIPSKMAFLVIVKLKENK